MTRARDDRRRNARAEFALYDADREPVGSFSIGHADGCQEGFTEDGDGTWADVGGEWHVPGSHDELHRVLVAPRRVFARQRSARGIPTVPERCRCIAGDEHYVSDHENVSGARGGSECGSAVGGLVMRTPAADEQPTK